MKTTEADTPKNVVKQKPKSPANESKTGMEIDPIQEENEGKDQLNEDNESVIEPSLSYADRKKVAQKAKMTMAEKKDEIKKMILDSDNKALSKAVRGNHQTQGIQSTMSPKANPNRFGNLVRGSTVKRSQKHNPNSHNLPNTTLTRLGGTSYSPSDTSSPPLEESLSVNTMYTIGSADSSTTTEDRLKANASTTKEYKHPLEKVRPRKIHVQPKSPPEDKGSQNDMSATGSSVGSHKGATSQACVLQ